MQKLFLITLILLLNGKSITIAQSNNVDSLINVLKSTKEDTIKINILTRLARVDGWAVSKFDNALQYAQQAKILSENQKPVYKSGLANAYLHIGNTNYCKGNFSEALINYQASVKLNIEINDKTGTADVYTNIGNVNWSKGDFLNALKYYSEALKIRKEMGDKLGIGIAYNNIANVYFEQGNYPEAQKNYLSALKIAEVADDKYAISASYSNLGSFYFAIKNYKEALNNHFAALKIRERQGDKQGSAESYSNIGNIYFEQGNDKDALKNYLLTLKIQSEIGDEEGLATTYSNIGNIYAKQNNNEEALKKFWAALKIQEKNGDKKSTANTYNCIGSSYFFLQKIQDALKYTSQGLKVAKEVGLVSEIRKAYRLLASIDSVRGDYKSAYKNYIQYIFFRDSIKNEANTKKITQQQMQYDFDKKEAATKAEQEKKDIRQRNIRYTISAGLLGALIFLGVVYRQRNNINKEKQRSDELLLNILPAEVAEELKTKGEAEAKQIDEVTVLFTDFKGFTELSEKLSPKELVSEINTCFKAFDHIMHKYGVEKIKTIGDAYMAAGGLPIPNNTHAEDVVKAALEIQQFMHLHKLEREKKGKLFFEIRIGIHTGPVVAGIVGVKKFSYDIWGDTVNTASRMESSSEAGKINISETTYALVKDKFSCTHRGKISAKGKGEIDMYFVN